jgi:hypothetical protein
MGLRIGTEFTYVKDIGKDVVRGLRFKGKTINKGDKVALNSILDLVLGDGKER